MNKDAHGRMLRFFHGLILVLALSTCAAAQNTVSLKTLDRFLPVWRYHEGDDSLWSHPAYPELGWEPVVGTEFFEGRLPERGWTGIGWFRTHIHVDESLVGIPVSYGLTVRGAAELYFDGKLVHSRGRVGSSVYDEIAVNHNPWTLIPGSLVFDSEGEHVLAVRTSNFGLRDSYRIGGPIGGFNLRFAQADRPTRLTRQAVRSLTAEQFLFMGIPAAFAVVFLLLFLLRQTEKAHLYFALLCMVGGAMVFLDLQSTGTYDGADFVAIRRFQHAAAFIALPLLMVTTHLLLSLRIPIYYWAFAVIGAGLAIWSWMAPFAVFPYVLPGFGLIVMLEITLTCVKAIVGRRKGAWIVGLGILAVVAGIAYDSLLDLRLIYPFGGLTNGYYYGMTALEVSMALFLSISFARTNRNLEEKLVEVERLSKLTLEQEREAHHREVERTRLEAENERKALELEKAKQLRRSYDELEKAHEELKSTQARLVHSEKMASLGRLSAGIAHEIKNPLNFINNFAALSVEMATELRRLFRAVREDQEAAREAEEVTETLLANARRIAEHGKKADGVVKSLMEHARGPGGEHKSVDLNTLIDHYIHLSHRGVSVRLGDVNVNIQTAFDPEVGFQEIEPESFGRALMNLLDNAFEAAASIDAGPDHVPEISVSTSLLDESVLIRIVDNGPGISEQIRERIFEPFFTTKPTGSGTGLGLSLAHDIIVDGHGGTIGLEQLSTKTAFYLTIPAKKRPTEDLGSNWPESF
jgi:signal transduction histidine kinase